jgi:thiol-disulfide isomerase/thioredoxin
MLERLIIAGAILALGALAYSAGGFFQRRRAVGEARVSPIIRRVTGPTILYFWSESCAPCKAIQEPALRQLERHFGPEQVQVIEINALESLEIAKKWGVMSLPTTILLDRQGQPRTINNRPVRFDDLRRQVEAVA